MDHILKNVIGFDIHPLAVTIAKTNYLLSIKELLKYRSGNISIPVYMSNSLKLPEKIEQTKMDDLNPKLKYEAGDIRLQMLLFYCLLMCFNIVC